MTFQITNASEQNFVILEMGHPGLFFVFIYFWLFKNYNFYNKYMCKNVHPVNGAGIWTHYLQNVSLLP